jgi:hypothetical protein
MGESDGRTAQEKLRLLYEAPETPGELRGSILAALRRMNPELADRLAAQTCPAPGQSD